MNAAERSVTTDYFGPNIVVTTSLNKGDLMINRAAQHLGLQLGGEPLLLESEDWSGIYRKNIDASDGTVIIGHKRGSSIPIMNYCRYHKWTQPLPARWATWPNVYYVHDSKRKKHREIRRPFLLLNPDSFLTARACVSFIMFLKRNRINTLNIISLFDTEDQDLVEDIGDFLVHNLSIFIPEIHDMTSESESESEESYWTWETVEESSSEEEPVILHRRINHEYGLDWQKMPRELLREIVNTNILKSDLIQCLYVCKSWHEFFSGERDVWVALIVTTFGKRVQTKRKRYVSATNLILLHEAQGKPLPAMFRDLMKRKQAGSQQKALLKERDEKRYQGHPMNRIASTLPRTWQFVSRARRGKLLGY